MCTARDTLFTCDLEPSTRVASVSRLMNELRAPQVRIDAAPGQTLLMRNSIGAEHGQSLTMWNSNWIRPETTHKRLRQTVEEQVDSVIYQWMSCW